LTNHFKILTASSVDEVGADAWDALSAGRPFQSARWYRFGERVMEDCSPIYIILSLDNQPVARGTFWLVRTEPLPVAPFLRSLLAPILQRWPLLICRSPLSNSSGLILPEEPLRESALQIISDTAAKELRRLKGSFLLFDYLETGQTKWAGWPAGFRPMEISGPGTRLALEQGGFDNYLKSHKKFRIHQHFRRSSQEAADLGIQVTRQTFFCPSAGALELIHNVERRHDSMPNPWAAGMLAHMQMVESSWLTATIRDRLVGCMLLLMDNGVQIAALPGLTEDVPFAYFMLLYEAIQDAFEKNLTCLRWGSGAYETKRRLGFELEKNNFTVVFGLNPLFRSIASLMGA
jgi:hypothetical protein